MTLLIVGFVFTTGVGTYLTNSHADAVAREAQYESDRAARAVAANEMVEYLAQQHVATMTVAAAILSAGFNKANDDALDTRVNAYDQGTEKFVAQEFKNSYVINDTLGPLPVVKPQPDPPPKWIAWLPVDVLDPIGYTSEVDAPDPVPVIDPRNAWNNLMAMSLVTNKCIAYVYKHKNKFTGMQKEMDKVNCGTLVIRNGHAGGAASSAVATSLGDVLTNRYTTCQVRFIQILHAYSSPTFPGPRDKTRARVVSALQEYLDQACLANIEIMDVNLPPD